jgi:hypothetical protein
MGEVDNTALYGQALPLTQQERLTAQFYEWERRGRGWQLWGYPVELEPPFRPFFYHYAEPGPAVDDSRKPTILSSLVDGILGRSSTPALPAPAEEEQTSDPEPFYEDGPPVEFQVALPAGTKVVKEAAERLLTSLTYASRPIGFEVVGVKDAIFTQFACAEDDRTQLAQQLSAHFPESAVTEREGFSRNTGITGDRPSSSTSACRANAWCRFGPCTDSRLIP